VTDAGLDVRAVRRERPAHDVAMAANGPRRDRPDHDPCDSPRRPRCPRLARAGAPSEALIWTGPSASFPPSGWEYTEGHPPTLRRHRLAHQVAARWQPHGTCPSRSPTVTPPPSSWHALGLGSWLGLLGLDARRTRERPAGSGVHGQPVRPHRVTRPRHPMRGLSTRRGPAGGAALLDGPAAPPGVVTHQCVVGGPRRACQLMISVLAETAGNRGVPAGAEAPVRMLRPRGRR